METFTNCIVSLCEMDGTPGWEDPVRDSIVRRVSQKADDVRIDSLGNLLVFCRGKIRSKQKVMLCAHMDEVGLIVKAIRDDGCLSFAAAGGVDARVLPGKRVRVGLSSRHGVIAFPHAHLLPKEERESVFKLSSLFVDIGADSRSEAEAVVTPGDPIFFDTPAEIFGDNMLRAKAIDDRVGCAILCQLIDETPPVDTWFVFTAQEEVGTRGAAVASRFLMPDLAVVIEGTTAADLPSLPPHRQVCSVGNGPVIPFMDRGSAADVRLYQGLVRIAEKHAIRWQTKEYISGGTDAAAVQTCVPGVATVGIAAPVRYIHAPVSVVSLDDCRSMLELTRLFLETATTFEFA